MITALLLAAFAQETREVPEAPRMNAQLYRQPLDAEMTMWTNDASARPDLYYTVRAGVGYTRDPLVFQWDDGDIQRLLKDALQLNLAGTFHYKRLRIGLDVPIYLLATSDLQQRGTAGLGPLLLDLKGTLVDHERGGFGLALAGRMELPTNTTQLALGRSVAGEFEVIGDVVSGGFLAALNVGYRVAPREDLAGQRWDDALLFRVGLGYHFDRRGGVSLDLAATSAFRFGEREDDQRVVFNADTTPVEVMAGGWGRLSPNIVLRGGVGTGVTGAIGSPMVRGIVSVAWEPEWRKPEPVVEPVVDRPDAPETPKAPGPGRLMVRTIDVDQKPVAANVTVTWKSVPDLVVMPSGPMELPVASGVGMADLVPGRVMLLVEAEGYQPVEIEGTILPGEVTAFTVPMMTKARKVGNERIVITEQVFFDLNKATIKPESFQLLKEVAFLVRQYPQIRMLRVEGHTDSRGSDEFNFRLSNDRAESVLEFLVAQGVERARVNAVGYGERRPLDPRENEEAWALNRRVDFVIEAWDDTLTPVESGGVEQGPVQQAPVDEGRSKEPAP